MYISELEYILMGLDGVRAVNYVCLTQDNNYKLAGGNNDLGPLEFDLPLYSYEYSNGTWNNVSSGNNATGASGYGYKFDFRNAQLENGSIIRPSSTPSVFELKNPNDNVKGIVR